MPADNQGNIDELNKNQQDSSDITLQNGGKNENSCTRSEQEKSQPSSETTNPFQDVSAKAHTVSSSPTNTPNSNTSGELKDNGNKKTKFEISDVEKQNSKCRNSLKQCAMSWRSFAPRTRKLIQAGVMVFLSIVGLIAMFLLVRLAESGAELESRPPQFSELNIIKENPQYLPDAPEPQPEEDYQDFHHEIPNFHKDQNGKVIPAKSPEVMAAVDSLMEKAGPDAVMHPELGVPVPKDYMKKDILRIKAQRRRFSKPATESEIEKTLEIVQSTVDADRKKLSRKELRLWTPGDTPLRILLVTTWRSGSTFLGQVLEEHPGVFQHYEPLSHIGVRQVRSGKDAFQTQQLLHRLLECSYSDVDKYLNYTKNNPQDMLGHNKRIWEACSKKGPNPTTCYNSDFLTDSCKMFPIQLVKSVRMRLNLTQIFLNDAKFNVKVVFLVRDPRATMSSRYSSVSWCSDHPDCSSPESLCSDMKGDLKVATAFQKLYPNKFTMIKYEDLATNPEDEIKNLLDFLELEFSEELANYIREHTQTELDKPWSTKRKSSDRISLWKKQLPLQEIHTVQNACGDVLKSLNYEIMGQ